jgi:predicted DNA-binding transcriptional regulator AlpA
MVRREVTSHKPCVDPASLPAQAEQSLPPPRLALSIPEFCDAHGISQDFFYKLKRQGQAPRLMKVGARTLISLEAAAEWRREQEAVAT